MLSLRASDEIAYNGSNNTCRMDLFADTASDLTGVTTFDSIVLLAGSSALDISTGDLYRMQSDGTWILQPGTGAFSNVYTKTEIDNMIGDIDSDISDLQDQDIDTIAALTQLINSGGKNLAQITSGSDTRYIKMGLEIPAGDYVLTIGEISSTDTDASVCRIAVANSADSAIYAGGTTRGNDKEITFSISEPAAYLYVYASDSYAHSSGDTVTITDLMVCSQQYWNITSQFTDYCPTLSQLYDIVSTEIAGLNSLIGGGI